MKIVNYFFAPRRPLLDLNILENDSIIYNNKNKRRGSVSSLSVVAAVVGTT